MSWPSAILEASADQEIRMRMPDLSHIHDSHTRAAAQLAAMQFEAAHAMLLANQEMYGAVSMNATIVVALAQVIATNHANLAPARDVPPR
jgi:hypothetical protein